MKRITTLLLALAALAAFGVIASASASTTSTAIPPGSLQSHYCTSVPATGIRGVTCNDLRVYVHGNSVRLKSYTKFYCLNNNVRITCSGATGIGQEYISGHGWQAPHTFKCGIYGGGACAHNGDNYDALIPSLTFAVGTCHDVTSETRKSTIAVGARRFSRAYQQAPLVRICTKR